MEITGVDFVAVPSTDWKRSRAFYVETLGLRPDATGQAEFWVGQTCFGIYEPTTFGLEFAPQTTAHLALHVDDVAAARADLEAKGVEFEGDVFDTGVCHMAFFTTRTATPDAPPPLLAAQEAASRDHGRAPTSSPSRSPTWSGRSASTATRSASAGVETRAGRVSARRERPLYLIDPTSIGARSRAAHGLHRASRPGRRVGEAGARGEGRDVLG